jgi:hypothetical protein
MKKIMFAVFGFAFVTLSPIFLSADTNSAGRAVYAAPCDDSDPALWCVVLEPAESSYVFKKENNKMITATAPREVKEVRVINNADLKKWGVTLPEIVRANHNISKKYEMQKKEKTAFHNFTEITHTENLFVNKTGGSLVISEEAEELSRLSGVVITCLAAFLLSMILFVVARRLKNAAVAFAAFVAAFVAAAFAFAAAVAFAAFVAAFVAAAFAFAAAAVAVAAFAATFADSNYIKAYRISVIIYAILFSTSMLLSVGALVAGIALVSGAMVLLGGWLISRRKQKVAA